ncbi:hypothetical protein AWM70_08810 [Paenibacillus yonginensis]|uniref:ABC transporter substrate-binding protein n=1 Tax=Paenibacillus yonginensis TaxID=1462996 RepID=A0A1B1MZS3_9BACL|nr:sugar ABC transporter substrate-binding protein [Paenibacillus yonginensis]ANS74674.1 hypothetical protein AWM70_08810 [Paenibacillus yonginensis]
MNRLKMLSIGVLIAVFSATVLTACSSNSSDSGASSSNGTTASGKKVTINYYDWTDEQVYMDKVVNGFEKKYPNIKVNANYIPTSDYQQKLLVNLSTGEDMDVFATSSTSNLAEYTSKQVLEPLDDLATSSDLAGISESIKQLNYEGHIYGLPYRTSKWVLYYNKDIFDKAGVAYPDSSWTWDKYEQVAKQLSSGSGQNKVYGSMSYQAENNWWRVLANIKGANNPMKPEDLQEFKKVLQYYYNLTNVDKAQQPFSELVGNAGNDYAGRFLQGNVGMMWNGDWAVQQLNDTISSKNVKMNYDVAPLPHWEGSEPATTGSYSVVMVNKESSHMDAAKTFAAYVASEEAAQIFASNGLLTPWNTDSVKQAFQSNVTTPEHVSVLNDPIKVLSQVPMDPLYNQVMNIMKEETTLYLLDKQSLDKTIQNMQSRFQKEVHS